MYCGAPGEIRTCGTQRRRLVLYPTELQTHKTHSFYLLQYALSSLYTVRYKGIVLY